MNATMDIQALVKARKEQLNAARPQSVLEKAYVANYIKTESLNKLKALHQACSEIIAAAPVYDRIAKEDRKWKPQATYGYGEEMQLLSGLISGIRYSAAVHKDLLQEETGLDDATIEMFLTALGQTPYYSSKANVVVEGTPLDLEALQGVLMLIEDTLGIVIDKSALTPARVQAENAKARMRAEVLIAEQAVTERQSAMAFTIDTTKA